MTRRNMALLGGMTVLLMVSCYFAEVSAYAQYSTDETAKTSELWNGAGARSIEGVWDVTVTLRNCADGSAIRSFPRLNTFMQGGTMQETAAGGTAAQPALRSPGHGIWEHTIEQNFKYTIKFLRLNADGSPAGFVRETRDVEVDTTGMQYSATGTSSIYLPNGAVLGPFCATEAGVKLGFD